VTALEFIDDETFVTAGAAEVSVWKTNSEQPLHILDVPSSDSSSVKRISVLSQDKKTVIACIADHEISLYSISKASKKVIACDSRV